MIRILATLALLATAVAPPPADQPPAADRQSRSCITAADITNRHAEDGRTIRFDLIGGRTYRNRLEGECPGLRAAADGFGTLAFDVHGDSLCRGDLVRVLESGGARAGYAAAIPCPLGDFVPGPPARDRGGR